MVAHKERTQLGERFFACVKIKKKANDTRNLLTLEAEISQELALKIRRANMKIPYTLEDYMQEKQRLQGWIYSEWNEIAEIRILWPSIQNREFALQDE